MAKVTTGKVRLSYPHLSKPRENDDGTKKYTATLLIPKEDSATVKKIQNAIADAAVEFREKNGQNSLPPKPSHTLHDGDKPRENGEAFGDECKGCYVITVSSMNPPLCLDRQGNEALDLDTEFYAGCYIRASINFKGYSVRGKKGITGYLNAIKKVSDGEPLGGARASAADFDDGYEDEEDDIFA